MSELTDIKMTSDLSPTNNEQIKFGHKNAKMAFYLPTAPIIPTDTELTLPDTSKIIELNGNHWRKIFTIMAKITAENNSADCWKKRRADLFTTKSEAHDSTCLIINSAGIDPHAEVHILCGQVTYERLQHSIETHMGLNWQDELTELGEKQKVMAHKQVLITPYLDYRQFPNQLIEAVRDYLKQY